MPGPFVRFAIIVTAFAVALSGAREPARGGQTAVFQPGEVIRLVVPFSPGGGFDRVARIIQPSLEQAIKDLNGGVRVTVIVENRPGAGGQVGAEHVFNAPPDGTRLVLLASDGAPLQETILGARFRLEEFTYIGQANRGDWGLVVRANTGLRRIPEVIERAQRRPILFGTTGAGGGDRVAVVITQAVLRQHGVAFPVDYVHFDSTAEVLASMQRGEVEAYYVSVDSALPAVRDGYARIVGVFAERRSEYAPEVPTAFEQGMPGAATINPIMGIMRILAGPPGIPAPRAGLLREALQQALADPLLLRRAVVIQVPIIYAPPDQARAAMLARREILVRHQEVVRAAVLGR